MYLFDNCVLKYYGFFFKLIFHKTYDTTLAMETSTTTNPISGKILSIGIY